jgi:hypothetical protein
MFGVVYLAGHERCTRWCIRDEPNLGGWGLHVTRRLVFCFRLMGAENKAGYKLKVSTYIPVPEEPK